MFAIYNTDYERLVRKQGATQTYSTMSAAKAAATRMNNKNGIVKHVAMAYAEYNEKFNPMVETTNIMSGKTCMIRKSELGGCTDPGTERYWSM